MSATQAELPSTEPEIATTIQTQAASEIATTAFNVASLLSTEEWVQSLGNWQFNLLLPEHVQYLTTGQLQSIQGPDYFRAWRPETRAALTAAQVRQLNISELEIGLLTAPQISALTASQVQQVKFYEFHLLPASHIPNLTPAQVASIPQLGYFEQWSVAARAALTATQVQSLRIDALGLSGLTKTQIGALTPTQIRQVRANEFPLLNANQIQHLTADQISTITHLGFFQTWSSEARGALQSGQVQLLNIDALGIASLTSTQISWLTASQIKQVRFYELHLLNASQIPFLSSAQITSIPQLGYFQQWSKELRGALLQWQVQLLSVERLGIGLLTPSQITGLTFTQIKQVRFYELNLLDPRQVPFLSGAQVASIRQPGYFQAWSREMRAALLPWQVQRLNIGELGVSQLTASQISSLTVNQVQQVKFYEFHLLPASQVQNLTSAQVASIPQPGYFKMWTAAARAALTTTQVTDLRIDALGIADLTQAQIGALTSSQIRQVKASEFPLLVASQVHNLSNEQVGMISQFGYFQAWPKELRAALEMRQVQLLDVDALGISLLTPTQISWLTYTQIKQVRFYEHALLNVSQIPFLSAMQVASIPQLGYFQAWSEELRGALLPWQVQLLNIEQLGISQLNAVQIAALTPNQVQQVKSYEFLLLPPSQIPHLTTMQIGTIRHAGFYQAWSAESRAALNPTQVRALAIDVLGIRELTSTQIGWLTRAQVQMIPYLQIAFLSPGQIPWLSTAQMASIPTGAFLSDLPMTIQTAFTREQLLALPLNVWADYGHEPTPPSNYTPVIRDQVGPDGLSTSPHATAEAERAFALVPYAQVTHSTIASGNWSDPKIWRNGQVPAAGAKALISAGTTVTFDLVMNVALKTLRIDGTLSFAVNRNTQLKVDTVVVNTSGKLFIGTEANPIQSQFTARILIADGGPIDRVWDPYMLSRGVISRGEVKMYGREVTPYVSLLVDPMYGSTTLSLAEVPVGWRVGDKLVIAGVDEMAPNGGAEERTILAINGTTVTIAALQMNHDAPNGYGVSIQVANLSRNIQLIAEDASVIAERPHLMFMHNPNVSVQNVGIYGFGRTDKSQPINDPVVVNGVLLPGTGTNPRARYAMHFHHTGVNPANAAVEVSGNVVVGSPGWGYVNHSSNVDFDSNVAYGVYGASFASEDGNEIGSMRYNLSISSLGMFDGVEVRADIHDFGFQGHGFWLQGPGVDVIGNIASGSRGGAFTIYTSSTKNLFDAVNLKDQSLAGGREAVPVGSVPFGAFAGNVAYGANTGVDIWRNLQVMNDRMSVVDGFFGWNISNVGIDIHYNGAVRVRNSVVLGDLQRYMGIGIRANFLTTGIVIENTELLGLELGVKAPVRQRTIIQGGAIAAVTGIEVEKGHAANRTVDISGVRFTTLSAAALNGRVQRNIYLFGPYDFMLAPARRVESLYSEDVVHYTPLGGEEVRLYYEEQLPSFVPFTQQNAAGYVPSLWMNLTNQQLQTLFGIRLRGGMAPASAMRIPGVFGGVGEAT